MTIKDLTDLLQKNMENTDIYEKLCEWMDQNAGKRLTAKNVPEGWVISKTFNITHLVCNLPEFSGGSVFISYQSKNVLIPTAKEFRYNNSSYFGAAVDRNIKRLALMNDSQRLQQLVDACNSFEESLHNLKELTSGMVDSLDILACLGDVSYINTIDIAQRNK